MTFKEELKARGLISSVTNEVLLDKLIKEKATIYCGFDPTASSLHIGHLVPIMMLNRFQRMGHKVLPVVGGGTGLIGDPSFRKTDRKLLTLEESLKNTENIKKQLSHYIDFSNNKGTLLNNYDWLKDLTLIDFLSLYGSQFPVNYMLAKDTVSTRLESGLTYTEFTYMIIQAIDFYNLYTKENCKIQLGGSDQWGNITSGTELIRRKLGENEAVGITLPLITKADGTKFGKSAGGSLWLDAELTSPYEIYQYFLNTADADVIGYLKVFTLLDLQTIFELEKQVIEHPEQRQAQNALASEIVKLMHSEKDLEEAIMMSEVLFSGNIKELSLKQLEICFKGVTSIDVENSINVVEALVSLGVASSKTEARNLLNNNAIQINGEKINDLTYTLDRSNSIAGKLFVIRKGKKNYFLIKLK
jgi:tyrosyl-tRNA synthetase